MKKCGKCEIKKPLDEFSKNKNSKDGFQNRCKECNKTHLKSLYDSNHEYYSSKSLEYYYKNKEHIITRTKIYKEKNKDKIQIYNNNYTELNKDKKRKIATEWAKNNKKHLSQYMGTLLKSNPLFKLSHNTRNLINGSFKRTCKGKFNKSKKTEDILGCTLEEFTQYLQSLFTEGMTLENYGEWEIDHIVPISSAITKEEIYKLNHYSNLQPLWKSDNRSKGKKTK
jgi:hypothetical protein